MACVQVEKVCQVASAAIDRGWDYTDECARLHTPGSGYGVGDIVRPAKANGFEYLCTVAGQTSLQKKVTWKNYAALDAEFDDGSARFKAQAISIASLRKTISSSIWTAPSGFVVDSGAIINAGGFQQTTARFHGGTAGTIYAVVNSVIFSDGTTATATFNVEVE
jgi:hypothetical protein